MAGDPPAKVRCTGSRLSATFKLVGPIPSAEGAMRSLHLEEARLGSVNVFACERLPASAADHQRTGRTSGTHCPCPPRLKRKPGTFARRVLRDAVFTRSE